MKSRHTADLETTLDNRTFVNYCRPFLEKIDQGDEEEQVYAKVKRYEHIQFLLKDCIVRELPFKIINKYWPVILTFPTLSLLDLRRHFSGCGFEQRILPLGAAGRLCVRKS